jgi:predicted transcriptional regulator
VPGADVVIYTSSPVKKVTGKAKVASVLEGSPEELWARIGEYMAISKPQFLAYLKGAKKPAAIVLDKIERIAEPKPLPFRGPQSFRYLSAEDPDQRQILSDAGLAEAEAPS